MRKVIVFLLVIFSILAGYWLARNFIPGTVTDLKPQKEILKVALVADSHSDNELLKTALAQAKQANVNFVIGIGDYSKVGTVEELKAAKKVFDESGLKYFVTAGDHDLWDGRNQQIERFATESADVGEALDNFREVFGGSAQTFEQKQIQFVIVDNSDIYKGIGAEGWKKLEEVAKVSKVSKVSKVQAKTSETSETLGTSKLTFVFAHKTPYHPQSAHIMGEETPDVAKQAKKFMDLMEQPSLCHSERSEESTGKILRYAQDDKRPVQDDKSNKPCPAVDGFFGGDLHFFAKFNSPAGSVRMTTIGAVTRERNFQGPRFGILRIYEDYSWDVEDVEIGQQ